MMIKKAIQFTRALPLVALLTPAISLGDMVLDNSIIHFEPEKTSRQDVTVRNTGDQPLYIKVSPSIIHNPGTDQQTREKVINPKQAGLLVSPNKLVIPPKGQKLVRFVNLQPEREKEGVYRVTIEPVPGELIARQTGLKVQVGYEVLVLAQPQSPTPNLEASRDDRQLKLTNKGNTNIYLMRGKQCAANESNTDNCESLRDKRLYPGNEYTVALPGNGPVQYQLAIGNQNSVRTFH